MFKDLLLFEEDVLVRVRSCHHGEARSGGIPGAGHLRKPLRVKAPERVRTTLASCSRERYLAGAPPVYEGAGKSATGILTWTVFQDCMFAQQRLFALFPHG